jgi:hypothetical protein
MRLTVASGRACIQAVVKPGIINDVAQLEIFLCAGELAVRNGCNLTAVLTSRASSGIPKLLLCALKLVLPYVKVGKKLHTRW